ncbi:DEAD/DEAH box helicase [Roseospira visakhapatnamensis]|uniref:ATP-dependent RNA helicase RhlE n=1 Tax=Roseospira visakhapatnamensis TaxID=390880 RepID=A0A7W6RCA9_9PROT|nr:DEAD/DEAH box helicase [Roseospira visakhapatnamensis]MBB4265886.1 ATP-dependent RNA helicase RhlE [Roseospira visakhapatnamensis]
MAEPLLRAVADEGYTHPTPIQSQVIPALIQGRDVVGIAQTGTGKTASFVLPALHALTRDRRRPQPRACRALIVVPTRELAAQVADSIRTYGRHMRPSLAVVIGGARPGPQIKALAPGVDIVIATPGRLLDHLSTNAVRLDATTTVVLDEADQMLDLGFMPAIRRIMAALPRQRQTALLSATMPKPIRALASDFLDAPVEIAVAPAAKPIERIDQSVVHVDGAAKRAVLVDLLGCPRVERAIVFTRTKRGADKVARHLEQAGLSAAAIHGNKSQNQRERTLGAFRGGKVAVLVATDIAARGIDIDDVSHVFNYELPNVPESYVHRIGRTARAGRDGIAVSLCDPTERSLLRDIETLIGRTLAARTIRADGSAVETPPAATPARTRTAAHADRSGPRRPNGPGRGSSPKPARPGRATGRPDEAGAAGAGGRPRRRPRPAAVADGRALRDRPGADGTRDGLNRMLASTGR